MKKEIKWKHMYIMLFIVILVLLFVSFIYGIYESPPTKTANHQKADSNQQREFLFNHIGLNIEDFEITDSIEDSNIVSQWWYKGIHNNDSGIYIAIGDIQANEGNGFAEFDIDAPAIRSTDDYLLEISIGDITEDGHLDVDNGVRTYYFIQTDNDIAFVSLKQ